MTLVSEKNQGHESPPPPRAAHYTRKRYEKGVPSAQSGPDTPVCENVAERFGLAALLVRAWLESIADGQDEHG